MSAPIRSTPKISTNYLESAVLKMTKLPKRKLATATLVEANFRRQESAAFMRLEENMSRGSCNCLVEVILCQPHL